MSPTTLLTARFMYLAESIAYCGQHIMGNEDIRWIQRFQNFKSAFRKLEEAVIRVQELSNTPNHFHRLHDDAFLEAAIKESIIQRFEFTHELAWKVLKDFLYAVGGIQCMGSKDSTKAAFAAGLIEEGGIWMEMINSRNLSSHTYNEETANDIFLAIVQQYYPALKRMKDNMESRLPTA